MACEGPPDDPLQRYQEGDKGAFNDLVEGFCGRLRVFFYRHFWDRALADDLAQEVFVKIFKGIRRYQPRGCPDTFIWRIARNVLIDHLRSCGSRPRPASLDRRDEHQRTLGDGIPDPAPAGGPLDTLARVEAIERLREALEELSMEQRLAFEMGVLEGMKYAAIAEILEIPVGTVKSRVFNAVRSLRQLLPDLVPAAGGKREQGEPSPFARVSNTVTRRCRRSREMR